MPKKLDLTGQTYGWLTVIKESPYKKQVSNRKLIQWICRCKCGKIITVPTRNLRECHTMSCGCMLRSVGNMSYKRPWRIWFGMKDRCKRQKNTRYKYYGGKGISYDAKWEDFNNFWKDMKEGYSDNLTLDRIDYNKDYCKENCRWITIKEQENNRSTNIFYEVDGTFKTISQLAEEYNMKYMTLYSRLKRDNWDIQKALNQPLRKW